MATTAIKIEKGIEPPRGPAPHPIPAAKKERGNYPFADMDVGDSFLVPDIKSSAEISSAVSYRRNRYGERHMCRRVDGDYRVSVPA
jgi:hypothetical protein